MARTRLFFVVTRALAAAGEIGSNSRSAITRRDVLRLSAAAAGALAAGSAARSAKAFATAKANPRIAIIGGGAAGLTTAYRLQKQGLSAVLFEASNRWGGRMFTRYNFYRGMFCELGGELVDTGHQALRQLAEELGLSLEPLFPAGEREHDLYFFGGKLRSTKDMLDPASGGGAFVPIARQIAMDEARLRDEKGEYTDYARSLDAISLADYLKQFRGKTGDWGIDLIGLAYIGEFGLPLEDQSSLNLVDFITTKITEPFHIFGESDEAFRVKNGSSALINALVRETGKKSRLTLSAALTALSRKPNGIEVTIDGAGGARREVFDIVVLALPFTRLRLVKGIDDLVLTSEKHRAIRDLGYGNNAKVMCGTFTRSWRDRASGLPFPSNGAFYSDLPFQSTWETSRAQPGNQGIITNFLAGNAMPATEAAAVKNLQSGLAALSPKIGASLDTGAVTSFFWERHPYTLGSYACAKVGQYTTLVPAAKKSECDGRLHFAGEHTEPDFLGYMNGAIASGNRAADEIFEQAGLKASKDAAK